MNVHAELNMIKQVLANEAPDNIMSDVNRGDVNWDVQIPFDKKPYNSTQGQHPDFLMADGPRESLDK